MTSILDKFWHRTLRRPFYLRRTIDQGEGPAIILLHGLGRTGKVWQHLVNGLKFRGVRVVAFDLLGFGASPKPDWLLYGIDDHASAVIASLEKLHLNEPAILVGHSMGCLVAVRVARRRPDLIRHLVLYEMPLYEGLPQKRRYRLRTNLYFKLYKQIMAYQPEFNAANIRLLKHFKQKIVGFEVTPESWLPFARSLENSIMKQTTAEDIKHLSMPMDVVYGRFDMLVIRGKPQQFFGEASDHITAHTIKVRHTISKSASLFLLERIEAALAGRPTQHLPITDNVVG